MPNTSETQAYETDANPDAVISILSDPAQLPLWAPAFADSVTYDPDVGWRVFKDDRVFIIRVAVSAEARTVDYLREVSPGREGGAYLRVLPAPGDGSLIIMTLPVPPGADRNTVAATLAEELAALSRLATQPD